MEKNGSPFSRRSNNRSAVSEIKIERDGDAWRVTHRVGLGLFGGLAKTEEEAKEAAERIARSLASFQKANGRPPTAEEWEARVKTVNEQA